MRQLNERLWYGGDYNPDQWDEATIDQDFEFFKSAHINILTLPVFSWARLEPEEGIYDFEWLDAIFDRAEKDDIAICLATSTAAQPAWMSKKYPEMLPVDFEGRQRTFGGRVKFCPTNPSYRLASVKLAEKMATHFKNRESIVLWHIGNEYDNYCYCDHCVESFREWAKETYETLDVLNERWYMDFWGHRIYDWDEIEAPNALNEMWMDQGRERSTFQCISLDYKRFMNDMILECYLGEREAIQLITPEIPMTTNLMGTFKPLDYFKWAKHMDIISWDHYPSLKDEPYQLAMRHDLMRSLKNGQSFLLMEQTPSQQNWSPYNALKRPKTMALMSYQTLAHGGDSIMFFQMRRSRGNCEKFHGALIEHVGHSETRVFKECQQLGFELQSLGGVLNETRTPSKVAIIFDWDNWWALELSSGPSIDVTYLDQIGRYYKAFHDLNIAVDFVEAQSDLSAYEVVIAPMLYLVKEGQKKVVEDFVGSGGTFLTTTLSGYVDVNDQIITGGHPGIFRDVLGIWVEELDALFPDMTNAMVVRPRVEWLKSDSYPCHMLCDILHLEGAEALCHYGKDFYKGLPCVTVNHYGKGKAYYIGTVPEDKFLSDLIQEITRVKAIKTPLEVPKGVEVTVRKNVAQSYYFVMNHNVDDVKIELPYAMRDLIRDEILETEAYLSGKEVWILKAEATQDIKASNERREGLSERLSRKFLV